MTQPWEYESSTRRNRRLADQFLREARLQGWNNRMAQQFATRGIDPALAPRRVSSLDRPMIRGRDVDAILQEPPEKKGQGFVRRLAGAIDEGASAVFGGEVRQPWDTLRPLKRLFDLEHEKIARPLAEGIYEGVGFGDYEDAPGVVKFGLETLTSPSTYVGPGAVKAVLKGGKAASGAVGLSKLAQNTASPALGTASRFVSRLTKTPPAISGGATSNINDVPHEALGRLFGDAVTPQPVLTGRERAVNALKETAGIGTPADEIATPIMRTRAQLKRNADSLANRLATTTSADLKAVFAFDQSGRIPGLPGSPTLQDVAARLPEYDQYIDDAQRQALSKLRSELEPYESAAREQGVEFGRRADILEGSDQVVEGGFYVPRGSPKAPGEKLVDRVGTGFRGRGKAGYRKSAEFERMTDAIDLGYEYPVLTDAVRGYAKRSAEDAVDGYTAQLLKGATDDAGAILGQTQSSRLFAQNPAIASQVAGLRSKLSSLKGSAARLDRKTHDAWDEFLDAAEPGLDELDTLRDSLIGLRVTRGMFKGLDVQASKDAIFDLKAQLSELRPAYRKALDKAGQTPRGEAQIGLPQLSGTSFPEEMANAANQWLKREVPSGGAAGAVKALNALMRGFNATADLSFMGIQGVIGLARDPAGYGRAWKAAMQSIRDPEALGKFLKSYDARAANEGLLGSRELAQKGLRIGGVETEYELGQGLFKGVGKLPVARESNRSFGFFGDALRLELARTLQLSQKGADAAQLVHAANIMTGWTAGRFMGDAGEFVQFAPRFFLAQLEMLSRAVADPTAAGGAARRALLQLVGLGTLTTVLANEALDGSIPLDQLVDPTSGNFMRIRAAGQDVSLFGPYDSLVKALVKGAEGDFEHIARTKASPLLKAAWDAIEGRSFMFEPALNPLKPREAIEEPERIETFLKGLLPISAQQALRGGPDAGIALDFAGVKAAPLSKADLLDEAAYRTFRRSWHDLSGEEVLQLAEANPDLVDTRFAKEAQGVKKELEGYWALEDQVWDRLRASRPELEPYETEDAYIEAKEMELRRMGMPVAQIGEHLRRAPVIRALDNAMRDLRRRWRAKHPEGSALLEQWYGLAPLRV
jgi:hypothetical protein